MPPVMCTIIAKNYLAMARVVCRSFLKHHPEGTCYVLVIDEWDSHVRREDEPFTLLSLSDLPLPEPRKLCFRYFVVELATAVKPWLLRYLLQEKGVERLLYLDPDTYVTGSLAPLYESLKRHPVIVTPHVDTDFPSDGAAPDDVCILRHGIFNLGFLGVSADEQAIATLEWLQNKLEHHCIDDPDRGYFVEQRFFDLAFALFPWTFVERSPAYNAAYWNIHSRSLSRVNGAWQVNGVPLRFYHFSSYNPLVPGRMSRHDTRHSFENRPDLRPLFEEYTRLLLDQGFETCSQWPYGFAETRSGLGISPAFRAVYRETPELHHVQDPFASAEIDRAIERFEGHARRLSRWRSVRRRIGRLIPV